MRKKDSGFAEKLLPVLLSTGMVFGLVLISGQLMEVLRIREQMNQIARAYLLEMESVGYLENANIAALRNELEQEGLKDIDFSGTTITPAGYGDNIQLVIEGNLNVDLKVAVPLLYEASKGWAIPIQIRLLSTAKH